MNALLCKAVVVVSLNAHKVDVKFVAATDLREALPDHRLERVIPLDNDCFPRAAR